MILEKGYIEATALFLPTFLTHLGFNSTSQLMAPNFVFDLPESLEVCGS